MVVWTFRSVINKQKLNKCDDLLLVHQEFTILTNVTGPGWSREFHFTILISGQNRRFSDNSFLWSKSQPAQQQMSSLSNRSHKPSFNISAFGSNPTVRRCNSPNHTDARVPTRNGKRGIPRNFVTFNENPGKIIRNLGRQQILDLLLVG